MRGRSMWPCAWRSSKRHAGSWKRVVVSECVSTTIALRCSVSALTGITPGTQPDVARASAHASRLHDPCTLRSSVFVPRFVPSEPHGYTRAAPASLDSREPTMLVATDLSKHFDDVLAVSDV